MGKNLPKVNFRSPHFSAFVEDLIANLPIGFMLLDQNGTILKMNKKQEETSRIRRGKILGKTFHEAFPKVLEQGVKKHYVILAYSWGDMMTDIIQPFWAIPLLAIAGLKFGQIMGYCTVIWVFYAIMITICMFFMPLNLGW